MFESQKTKNAAQTVAAALQRVRFKAMEEQKTYGIEFQPFENNQNVAVQMKLVKMGNNVLNSSDIRIKVISGNINLCVYDQDSNLLPGDTNYYWTNSPNSSAQQTSLATAITNWNQQVTAGCDVQFGRQGRLYRLATPTTLAAPYHQLTLPENSSSDAALEYKIVQSPRSSLTPPVVLPRGTVIDLAHSAGCNALENLTNYNHNKLMPIQYILFTPNGYIDYFDGNYNPYYGGLIYLCIGEWERGLNLAEDGKNNIETMTNFWVTLNPKTGQVRVTEMAPYDSDPTKLPIENARKFAAEHFGISE
jgi:hypothetical protein